MATSSERKQRWREKHPERDRKRRELDNENRRYAKKVNREEGRDGTHLTCSRKGCNNKGQVHHDDKNRKKVLCRQHHQVVHNARGDGPGSKGPGRHNESDHAGGLIHHPSHDRLKQEIECAGIVHSNEGPVDLLQVNRGCYEAMKKN